jgi:hypothetical protein
MILGVPFLRHIFSDMAYQNIGASGNFEWLPRIPSGNETTTVEELTTIGKKDEIMHVVHYHVETCMGSARLLSSFVVNQRLKMTLYVPTRYVASIHGNG